MANHARTRTTQLYDRRSDEVTLDEVERVGIRGFQCMDNLLGVLLYVLIGTIVILRLSLHHCYLP
jgi:hypothetical protein